MKLSKTNLHAKTAADLLEALGIVPSKKKEVALSEWSRWRGFPARTASGWKVAAVKQWIDAHAEDIAGYWTRVELVEGKKFDTARVATIRSSANSPAADLPVGMAHTQTELAQAMSRHYGNRISIVIDKVTVQDWRNGRRLHGATMPPPMNGQRWDVRAWIAWFDTYLLPKYRVVPSDSGELSNSARLEQLKLLDQVKELEQNQKRRDIENGLYLLRGDVERAADSIGARLNSDLTLYCETLLARRLVESLRALDVPEPYRSQLEAEVHRVTMSAADEVKRNLVEALGRFGSNESGG